MAAMAIYGKKTLKIFFSSHLIVKKKLAAYDQNDRRCVFFSLPEPKLTGELIGYPWIRRPSSVCPFTFSNIFSSETAWPIKAKFYVEPPWEGGTKVCINGPGHMTKMAAMPIYGKNLKKSSSPEPAGGNLVCSIGGSCPS